MKIWILETFHNVGGRPVPALKACKAESESDARIAAMREGFQPIMYAWIHNGERLPGNATWLNRKEVRI